MNDKLMLAMKAHRIGVEDAKLAFQLAVSNSGNFTIAQQAALLVLLQNVIVLPSRLVKEVFDADIER